MQYFSESNEIIQFVSTDQERIAHIIWQVCSPIIMALGTIGNVSAIVILLLRPRMRKMTTASCLLVLSISDLCVLYTGLLRNCILYFNDIDIRHLNQASCKIHVFAVYFFNNFSAWVLCAVTVERLIYVWCPFKAKVICTRSNGAKCLITIAVFLSIMNSHFFWTQGERIEFDPKTNKSHRHPCEDKNDYDFFYDQIWPWLESSLSTYVPFTVMIVCNALIIGRLVRTHAQRKRQISTLGSKTSRTRMTTMTTMLLTTTFTFLLLTTPNALFLSGQRLWWKEEEKNNPNFEIFWAISQLLMYLNSAINFLLYYVSGPRFRREVKDILTGIYHRRRIYPSELRGISTSVHTVTKVA